VKGIDCILFLQRVSFNWALLFEISYPVVTEKKSNKPWGGKARVPQSVGTLKGPSPMHKALRGLYLWSSLYLLFPSAFDRFKTSPRPDERTDKKSSMFRTLGVNKQKIEWRALSLGGLIKVSPWRHFRMGRKANEWIGDKTFIWLCSAIGWTVLQFPVVFDVTMYFRVTVCFIQLYFRKYFYSLLTSRLNSLKFMFYNPNRTIN
jgi:hypothetical protein